MNSVTNAEYVKAKEYALRSLACREQTEYQIRTKLQQRGYDSAIIESVITLLKEYNYINDRRFTEQYVAGHCKQMNRKQLQEHLYAKGIKADQSFDEYLELYQYNEAEILQKALNKYVQNKDLSDVKVRQKVIGYFLNKGYSYSMVQPLLMRQTANQLQEEE